MKIGLTLTDSGEKHQNYVNWLSGGEPGIEVITLSAGEDPRAIVACDALVLSGGVDIHPRFYGGADEYVKRPSGWKEDRDQFELSVLGIAMDRKVPVLGICRGLQLINVHLGGTLVQDLGTEGDETHEAAGAIDKRHPVWVEKASLLGGITGGGAGESNSAHHQAIDRLGEGLRVNCRAADGTIEGIELAEGKERSFLLGVQWHPERMADRENPLTAAVRTSFLEAIAGNMTGNATGSNAAGKGQ